MPIQGTLQITPTHVTGEVERITFSDPANNFAIVKILTPDGKRLAARGNLASLRVGEYVELAGRMAHHPDYGPEIIVESFRATLPASPEGISKYLAGAIAGIGKKTAEQITDFFGTDTLRILNNEPKRLLEIPGFGKKRLKVLLKSWEENTATREQLMFLQSLGISASVSNKLIRRYGEHTAAIVKSNPYRLADEVNGIGFLKADVIAKHLGIKDDDPNRLAAAAAFAMNQLNTEGHVCADFDSLMREMEKQTRVSKEQAASGIDEALKQELLVNDRQMLYTPQYAKLENLLPTLVSRLAKVEKFAGKRLCASNTVLQLAPEQASALEQVQKFPLSIITGGPGVGKTTVIGELVRRAVRAKLDIALAAPTGRAAKRLSEATGKTAMTIHRLLIFDPATGHFVHDSNNPLKCDLLIVDETSMLDLALATNLFCAVKPETSLVLVGDVDQLPSVGPGRILVDLINSGFFAVTRLKHIFRQQGNSSIITNAHLVNQGQRPEAVLPPAGQTTDFYWIKQNNPEEALKIIVEMVQNRIPRRFNFDKFNDIQVLTPMNKGVCGTDNLNLCLANALNNPGKAEIVCGEQHFRSGDKIMQIANNYDKNVFNGDLGRVVSVDTEHRILRAVFDNGSHVVEYKGEDLMELRSAYAITIHKSQGSEFPAVIVPILNQHYVMLRRNLIYTAMTRAKKLLILVGDEKAVDLAVHNARVEPRMSQLGTKLRELRLRLEKVKKISEVKK